MRRLFLTVSVLVVVNVNVYVCACMWCVYRAIGPLLRSVEADPENLEALLDLGVSYTNELAQAQVMHSPTRTTRQADTHIFDWLSLTTHAITHAERENLFRFRPSVYHDCLICRMYVYAHWLLHVCIRCAGPLGPELSEAVAVAAPGVRQHHRRGKFGRVPRADKHPARRSHTDVFGGRQHSA